MSVQIHDLEQGTDEWHELRAGKYTGSNADKLLKHAGSTKMINGVVSKYAITEMAEFGGNFWTKRGHMLEEEAVELYEAITNTTVERPGFVTNSRYPLCGYSPDGLQPVHLIEVKCFDEPRHLELFDGQIPLKILAQIHFGMTVCERKAARLLIYNPKLDPKRAFKIIEIKARPAVSANFKRILKGGVKEAAASGR